MAHRTLGEEQGLEIACWRPKDWGTIETTLKKQKPLTRLSRESSGAITSVVGYERTTG